MKMHRDFFSPMQAGNVKSLSHEKYLWLDGRVGDMQTINPSDRP
jgi:hypothetical protein